MFFCCSSSASASSGVDFWKDTEEKRQLATEVFRKLSPQGPTPGQIQEVIDEAERITKEAAERLDPSDPRSRQLWRQMRTTLARGLRFIPRLSAHLALGLESFKLGWKIGTGINAIFIEVGLPPAPPGMVNPMLYFHESGVAPTHNATPLPEDAWVLSWYWAGQRWSTVNVTYGYGGPCASLSDPPTGFNSLLGTSPSSWCAPPGDVLAESFWLPEDALPAVSPIVPYTGQQYDLESGAPTPLTPSEVEAALDAQLGLPANELLRDWLNYEMGLPGAVDPVGDKPQNPDIPFPLKWKKFGDHATEFDTTYTDVVKYWRDAADIVRRGREGTGAVETCVRSRDEAEVFWDFDKQAIVIVRGGEIETYFPPEDGYDYFQAQCV